MRWVERILPRMRNDLRDARVKAGLTQAQLADLIDRDQGSISRYESGESAVTVDVAPKLASALGLDLLAVLYPDLPQQQDEAA